MKSEMKAIMTIVLMSFYCTVAEASSGGNVKFFKAEVTEAGTLAQVLGERADAIDSLEVVGIINADDFKTMWHSTFYGSLEAINLENVVIEEGEIPDYAFFDYDAQKNVSNSAIWSVDCICLRHIILPEGVTRIGEGAFSMARSLREINIPQSVHKLGDACFSECRQLTSPLVLPEGLEDVPYGCFIHCRELSEVSLPSTLKSIGNHAFYDCGLQSVNIPVGVMKIGDAAFFGCKMEEVTLPDGVILPGREHFAGCSQLKKLRLPENLEVIPDLFAFECKNLVDVNVPSSVKVIGNDAFNGCRLGRELVFPEGLLEIGAYAFRGATGLEEVSFPSTLALLGKWSCGDWASVKKLSCAAPVPPQCVMSGTTGPFGILDTSANGGIMANIPVYVPVGSAELYRSAPGWESFFNFIESPELTGVDAVEAAGGEPRISAGAGEVVIAASGRVTYTVYSADGRRVAEGMLDAGTVAVSLPSGIYVVRAGATTAKIAL